MALPLKTVFSLDELLILLSEYEVEQFVIGLPLHLSGHESPMSLAARKFADTLAGRTGKPVTFIDERLTSKTAEALLREQDMNRKRQKTCVDTVSATLILQSYLERTKT